MVFALTLLKGLIQLVFAAAHMGNLVRYVSQSVIVGFTAGAGVLIAVSVAADDSARAAYAEGLRLAEQGRVTAAIDRFDAVLRLDPAFPGARRNRGLLHARQGAMEPAIADLRAAVAREPADTAALLALAQCYLRTGRAVAAEQAIRQALVQAPDDAAAYRLLAQALLAESRAEAAMAAAEAGTRLAPAEPAHWRILAEARLAADDRPGAIDAFEVCRRLQDPPDAAVLWTLGQLYLQSGMTDEAARVLAAAAAASPDDAATPDRLHAAALAMLPLDPAHAAEVAALFVLREADSARALRLQAALAAAAGDATAAIHHARAAIAADPADPEARLLLGRLLLAAEDFAGALDQARHARPLAGARVPALHLEVDIFLRQSRWADALATLASLAAADPDRDYTALTKQLEDLVQNEGDSR
jgi:tetratricopeptide (TPR) repeat protein